MVEQTHTYFVHDVPYQYSVSGVWKVFFDDFDSSKTALLVLERAKDRGLQNILSSVYNLYMFFVMLKQLNPRSSQFWDALETTLLLAKDYNLQEYEANAARTAMHTLIDQGIHKKKPAGRSCYFLALCAHCTTENIQNVWKQNGELEALKGTLLHKRIELYIQELAKWQCESRHTRVRLSTMHDPHGPCPHLVDRARDASSFRKAMACVVTHIPQRLWDHPATQDYFDNIISSEDNSEFHQFEAWLSANSSLSPYRTEWSIYDENIGVAGQIDSLWIDWMDNNTDSMQFIMVDWKRAHKVLSPDIDIQKQQSFDRRGREFCEFAPAHPGPCRHMLDCAYNHYTVQQHLYSDFLFRKYDIDVSKMLLVQCHPNLTSPTTLFNEVLIEKQIGLSKEVLAAFAAGWSMLLHQNL